MMNTLSKSKFWKEKSHIPITLAILFSPSGAPGYPDREDTQDPVLGLGLVFVLIPSRLRKCGLSWGFSW